MDKIRFATVWLAGCSGCHMSFLDLDEWLMELAQQVEVVYSPVGSDIKDYPENVAVCLVEGGVANEDNLALLLQVRQHTKILISFGDCAVTANVPAMRNMLGSRALGSHALGSRALESSAESVLKRGYLELAEHSPQLPHAPGIVPELLEQVLPVHQVVPVEIYLPGCPPPADRIRATLEPLLRGEMPVMAGHDMIQFG